MEDRDTKCRVCLRDFMKKPRKLLSLFDGKSQNAERISAIAGIHVDDCYRDHLPSKICFKCSDSLMRAVQIRSLCIESDKFLRKKLLDLGILNTNKLTIDISTKTENIKVNQDDRISILSSDVKVEATETSEVIEDIPPEHPPVPEFDFFESIQDDPDLDENNDDVDDDEDDEDLRHAASLTVLVSSPPRKKPKEKHEICEVCGQCYSSSYINTHLLTHKDSGVEASKYVCDLCGLSFTLKSYVYSHMKNVHCSSKKWHCDYCGKSYAKKNTWSNHVRTHRADGRIYKCTVENCGKTFAQANKLSVHMRIHNNERPYTCSYCFRTFIHYTDHKRHVMGHTGERPYKCNFPSCLRGFIKKSELTAHEKTHQR